MSFNKEKFLLWSKENPIESSLIISLFFNALMTFFTNSSHELTLVAAIIIFYGQLSFFMKPDQYVKL